MRTFKAKKNKGAYKSTDHWIEAVYRNNKTVIDKELSFAGTPKKQNSAPRELDLFAKCCGATLRELIVNRGYSNIKYLPYIFILGIIFKNIPL